jgi:predicted nucleic acid-binding protein
MLFDTDVLIWIQRGNSRAAKAVDAAQERYLSVYSYMELLQCAKAKRQNEYTTDFLTSFGFIVVPLTENIGHRALVYIQEYSLSNGLRAGDAIVAATAVESNLTLISSNRKHFKSILGLSFKLLRP